MHNCPARLGGFEIRLNQHGAPSNSSRVFPSMLVFCAPACLCLQDQQEPAEEENHQHERRDGQCEEGQ